MNMIDINRKLERMSDKSFMLTELTIAFFLAICGSLSLLFFRTPDEAGLNIAGLSLALLICAGVPKLLDHVLERKMTRLIRFTALFLTIALIIYCLIVFL